MLVGDPLTPVTRKERVYLLAVSLIGIAIVKTGLVPSKIATLGIELNQPDKQALLGLLALVTAYFLIAFLIYAASDFVTRREVLGLIKRKVKEQHEGEIEGQPPRESQDEHGSTKETKRRRATFEPASRVHRRALRASKPVASESEPNLERASLFQTVFTALNRALIPILRQIDRIARVVLIITDRAFFPLVRGTNLIFSFVEPLTSAAVRLDLSTLRELAKDEELYQLDASRSSRVVASFQILFEFLLPILVGLYAIYILLTGVPNPPGSA